MNYPTSDIQFIAAMLLRTRAGDQITAGEANRLEVIATNGFSNSSDEVAPEAPAAVASPEVVHPDATRVSQA